MLDLLLKMKTPAQSRAVHPTRALPLLAALSFFLPAMPGQSNTSRALSAQDADNGPAFGCLRGQPLPACKTFWLLEMQAIAPLAQNSRTVERGGVTPWETTPWEFGLEWNVGHMWNVNDDWALGGVVTASTQAENFLGGLRGRARRWLNDDVSLEASFGYLRMDGQSLGGDADDQGVSADLRLNIRDQGSFFLRWDHLRIPETTRDDFGSTYYDPGGGQNALLVGVGTGSVPALVGSGTLLVSLAILFGIFIVNDAS